jgi:hypothetical protein
VTVIDNETAGVVVVETGIGTLVVKCGDSACSIPGPTDSYYLRLTKRPSAENDPYHLQTPITVQIAILTDGLADVLAVNGVAVNYSSLSDPILQPIGDLVPSRVFQGNLDLADIAGKATLTRANGSDLGSFIDEGLEAGQLIRLSGTAFDGDYYVESVTHTAVTLATTFGGTDSVEGVTISRLTNVGHFEGSVTVEIDTTSTGCSVADPCRRLVRDESDPLIPSSWLADGFLEGQRVEIYDGTNYGRFKIAIIRGTNETKDNKIEFTPENGLLFFTANGWNDGNLLSITANRLAAMVTFDDGNAGSDPNWYEEVEVTLVADLNYEQPITRQGVKVFPVSTHVLSKLQGPLAVEGGVTGADRSLQLGLKLPGEADGPLFAIGPQPPESKQIDVLNIFNDDSQQHLSGTMTSTNIQGLGLAKDLDFGPTYSSGNQQTFGEPAIFPGGISFGTVQFVDGKFQTNGGKSTIEVVNLMLGQGNDTFEVLGTLDPDVAVKLIGTVNIAAITPVPATFNAIVKLTRPQPFDWKSQGFLVGQPLHITGFSETFTVAGFGDDFTGDTIDNTIMYLTGPVVTQAQIDAAPFEVNLSKTVNNVTTSGSATGGTLTRAAGSWITDGFIVGQSVTINGLTGSWRVQAITDGAASLVLGNGPALSNAASSTKTVNTVVRTVFADDVPVTATGNVTIVSNNPADEALSDGGLVTRSSGTWADDGFEIGQWVMIDGLTGTGWRLEDILDGGQTLKLTRGSPLPASTGTKTVFVPGPHGGLTVIHGGGNLPLSTNFEMVRGTDRITRQDGLSWIDSGYAVNFANSQPMHVQIGSEAFTRTILGFGDSTCPYSDPFPGCGDDRPRLQSD